MLGVIIVDDELLMRIGLKSIIQWEDEGFTILGEAANGREALELAGTHRPDLIITDIKNAGDGRSGADPGGPAAGHRRAIRHS
ncbi:response regulator [Paenibacillus rhizoplanae]